MAAAAGTLRQEQVQVHAGGAGYIEVCGLVQFSTTDASLTFDMLIKNCFYASVTPLGPVNTDEKPYIDMTAAIADRFIQRPTTGLMTISRPGTKTSGLWVAFCYRGR